MGDCDRIEVTVWAGMCLRFTWFIVTGCVLLFTCSQQRMRIQAVTLCDFLLASNTWLR